MAYSVENRSPFMDHRLIEYAFSSNGYLKVTGKVDKFALRNHSLYEKFSDILDRSKIGFASPISIDTKQIMIEDLKSSKALDFPIFSKSLKLDLLQDKFLSAKWERFLFRVYQVHLWYEIYFGKERLVNE